RFERLGIAPDRAAALADLTISAFEGAAVLSRAARSTEPFNTTTEALISAIDHDAASPPPAPSSPARPAGTGRARRRRGWGQRATTEPPAPYSVQFPEHGWHHVLGDDQRADRGRPREAGRRVGPDPGCADGMTAEGGRTATGMGGGPGPRRGGLDSYLHLV